MGRVVSMLIGVFIVMSGINAQAVFTQGSAIHSQTISESGIKPQWVSLFDSNSFYVVGDNAYCTDVLGTAQISYGLAQGGSLQSPEGRTDMILTRQERDTGNLIIVGGPGINEAAQEFGGYLGISYDRTPHTSFTIHCERKSIYLDSTHYPYEDVCIIYVGEFSSRNVMLVWGYGWQGTYAGSVFLRDPGNWEKERKQSLYIYRDGTFEEPEEFPYNVFPMGAYGGSWIELESRKVMDVV